MTTNAEIKTWQERMLNPKNSDWADAMESEITELRAALAAAEAKLADSGKDVACISALYDDNVLDPTADWQALMYTARDIARGMADQAAQQGEKGGA